MRKDGEQSKRSNKGNGRSAKGTETKDGWWDKECIEKKKEVS